jgi:hypothetical protein
MQRDTFSKRNNYQAISADISVRQDAPHEFRGVLTNIAKDCGLTPEPLRTLICRVLRKRKNDNNWTEYPNVDDENRELIDNCQWYKVYDIVETIYKEIKDTSIDNAKEFETEINEYFIDNGIGWKLTKGLIEYRSSEGNEHIIEVADKALLQSEMDTARRELKEAFSDLAKRPQPDITGAIQHSMAALEYVARKACGDSNATLGEIIKKHPNLIPSPLDEAITKAWGYASNNARHIKPGQAPPSDEEAELIVGICASVITYLSNKI